MVDQAQEALTHSLGRGTLPRRLNQNYGDEGDLTLQTPLTASFSKPLFVVAFVISTTVPPAVTVAAKVVVVVKAMAVVILLDLIDEDEDMTSQKLTFDGKGV